MTALNKNAIYAILADSVYWDVRTDNKDFADDGSKSNWTPIPSNWQLIHEVSKSGNRANPIDRQESGFSARAYLNTSTNEVVVAYAGTNPEDKGDVDADIKLGTGNRHTQANEASIFYHEVKHIIENSNTPNATIKFTGHSLGGGLAGMMGILFDRNAFNKNSNFS